MPMRLEGSCRWGAISFSVDSHTPPPYQRCYCSICRKSAGGGGYAINIMGLADTLKVKGKSTLGLAARNFQHRPEPAPAKAGGCQFTSTEFTGLLEHCGITISMDGKGRCMDNIFVERL